MRAKARSKASNEDSSDRRQPRPRVSKDDPAATPIWDSASELAAEVPDSEWLQVPVDLARNLHHYLHGGPKEDE